MFSNFIESFFEFLGNIIGWVLDLLPQSPFADVIKGLSDVQYISWLNCFFPVSSVVLIMTLWITAISGFYFVSIVLRWVKAIS